jgi:hypothetical protein
MPAPLPPTTMPSLGPIRLEPDRWRHRRVLRRLRRRLTSRDLRLEFGDPTFEFHDPIRQPADRRDDLAEPYHQFDQLHSTQPLQRRPIHRVASLTEASSHGHPTHHA